MKFVYIIIVYINNTIHNSNVCGQFFIFFNVFETIYSLSNDATIW